MELEEWLEVYQAITLTTGVKERSYWMLVGFFLLANCLLLLPLAFLFFSYPIWAGKVFGTVLGVIGVLISFCWMISQRRAAKEVSHWGSLLRSVEGQFAGGEFHRSAYRLFRGEEVGIPETVWKANGWYPEVELLSRVDRIGLQTLTGLLPIIFLFAWIALTVAGWLIQSRVVF